MTRVYILLLCHNNSAEELRSTLISPLDILGSEIGRPCQIF